MLIVGLILNVMRLGRVPGRAPALADRVRPNHTAIHGLPRCLAVGRRGDDQVIKSSNRKARFSETLVPRRWPHHQWDPRVFHDVIVSMRKSAGLKSVPIVYATGNRATCVTVSGMLSSPHQLRPLRQVQRRPHRAETPGSQGEQKAPRRRDDRRPGRRGGEKVSACRCAAQCTGSRTP